MDDSAIRKTATDLVNHCLALTLRLTRLDAGDHSPVGVASGFLFSLEGATYLISAGHALDKGGWVIETDMVVESECRTACIPVNGAWVIKRFTFGSSALESVDVSWAKIDLDAFQKGIAGNKNISGKPFEFMTYQGPFGETPEMETPYIYASQNRVVIFEALGKRHLEREPSYEIGMEYTGRKTKQGLLVFSTPKHKGHAHFKGASGAPIIDPTGKIFAILVGGCEISDELYGYPLWDVPNLIRISEDSLKKH
jgi:hypothetical protein